MPELLIGRFEILKELSKSEQDSVYLAHDPKLDRQVVIKTLRNFASKTEQFMNEARLISKLQHPNIVSLFDTGAHLGAPFLVYTHIEGETLAQLLKHQNILPCVQAAEIICGVLGGLAYSHAQGVIHLDVKPANVLIANNGLPMLMDFSLNNDGSDPEPSNSAAMSGTPQYIAPEQISGGQIDALADIYAVGVMLYEMVTGESALSGDSIYTVLNRAVHQDIAVPSTHNERVDERLKIIILKSVAKLPEERYPTAAVMKQALQDYLGDTHHDAPGNNGSHGAVDFLLRRMRSKSDFPALSNIISEINKVVSSESESSSKLSRIILQDFALTNKLLKLVNTASYGQFGGTINTVSKAVVILGFETVRNIAMTLILLEFMQNKAHAEQLKDEVIESIFSSIVAAQLSVGNNIRDAEEIMVCAMFHNLGRMLATFYFFDESQDISRLVEQGESEDQAARKVLGTSYPELGLGVARSWNFPPRLMAGMRKLSSDKVSAPNTDLAYITVAVNLAHELSHIASAPDPENKHQSLAKLVKRYESATKISERELLGAIDSGMKELSIRSGILGIGIHKSPLLQRVREWSGHAATPLQTKEQDELAGITGLNQPASLENGEADVPPPNLEAILSAGIQDVTASLVTDFNLNDVLQMVLETIYRGVGFNRALVLVRDNKQNIMAARFGFGAGIDAVIPQCRFPLSFAADVFHLSIEKGLDIAIEDINAPNIVDKIPAWYRSAINAPCFMLLPIMLKDKAIGLFYADMLLPNSLNLTQQQLSLLRTLRNQAVLAIKQKSL